MRLRVFHTTRYVYPSPAVESYNEARLMPLSDDDQSCLDFRLRTIPYAPIFAYDLPYGRVHHFDLRAPHRELSIEAESLVVTHRHDPFAGMQLVRDDMEFYSREGVRQRYCEYLAPTALVQIHPETDRIAAAAKKQASPGAASFLVTLNRMLYRVLTYAPGMTNVNTSIQQVLEHKSGVCQDFAHLMLAVCRRQGIPARYVSGYLYTGARAVDNANGVPGDSLSPGLSDRDARDAEPEAHAPRTSAEGYDAMHAWVECLLPDGRWHGFDPTNNLLTNEDYVKVHYGRDYGDLPPLRGIYRGPLAHSMDVTVQVIQG